MTAGLGDKGKNQDETPHKRAYVPPELVEYGDIAKLTQGVLSTGSDGGSGKNMA